MKREEARMVAMEQATAKRNDLIIAGLGGQGILIGGKILASAAMTQYKNSLWLPSYATRVRGGPSECTVIFSDDEIDSPVLSKADVVILVDPPQLKLFEERVHPGGLLMVESAGLKDRADRSDIRILSIPALEMAVAMGDRRVSNMILLGVYAGLIKSIATSFIEEELQKRFGKKQGILSSNLGAFRKGLEYSSRVV